MKARTKHCAGCGVPRDLVPFAKYRNVCEYCIADERKRRTLRRVLANVKVVRT